MKTALSILTMCWMLTTTFLFNGKNQTCIQGKLTEEESGVPIIFGTILLYQNNVFIIGAETDENGMYLICDIDTGTYDLVASNGIKESKVTNVIINSGKSTTVNLKIMSNVLEDVRIVGYKVPVIKVDNTTQGQTITSEQIHKMPAKNINSFVAISPGVQSSDGSKPSIRGSRSEEQIYFLDGVRSSGSFPHAENRNEPISQNDWSNESYEQIIENKFIDPRETALSTFSIDVDRASYSNVRRYLKASSLPPVNAVRIEEMINYFDYDYDAPKGKEPLAIHTTYTECPWNEKSTLLHIGLQAKKMEIEKLPPSNIVFLVDVSGSMHSPEKLPLVQSSLKLVLTQLKKEDKISIVTYAGNAGIVLPPTNGNEKEVIAKAIENLNAGGSTNGAEGIITAYELAEKNYVQDGNNRVILATDGDFNVGISDNDSLEKLIEQKRKTGIFLTVLGYGTGNYKDDKMEILADKGNGNHAYIDNILEAKKTLVNEFTSTLYTLAKDVKIQIEFNPEKVKAYKLIGYENRLLNKEDFNEDSKDAGEMGFGHTVTAIYEIVPSGVKNESYDVDDLKYQNRNTSTYSDDLSTIKFRYKEADGKKSKMIEKSVSSKLIPLKICTDNVKFSIAVAQFGQNLRNPQDLNNYASVLNLGKQAVGKDEYGFRAEFLQLVASTEMLFGTLVKK